MKENQKNESYWGGEFTEACMRRIVSEPEPATMERWAPGAVPTVTLAGPPLMESALLDDEEHESTTNSLERSDSDDLWSADSIRRCEPVAK